jgi:hypothetical protein
MARPGLHFPAMCIQPADAVNVIGGGKYFGGGLPAASRKGGRGPGQLMLR